MLNISSIESNNSTSSSSLAGTDRLVQDWSDKMKPTVETDRLVRIGFRLTQAAKDRGEKERAAKALSVPKLEWGEHFGTFSEYLASKLEELQDLAVRARIESGKNVLSEAEYGIQGMLSYLESKASECRLSKESIQAWFSSEIAPLALVQVVSKLGWNLDSLSSNQEKKVEQVIKGLGDMIAALSGSKTRYTPEQVAKLRVYVGMAGQSSMSERLDARLVKMLEVQKEEEEDLFDAL